ncbi:endonuclease/exonuclease/phosphatase family protein [Phaeobacter sp. J2-8]|uniref:endonuclease/exonuclease/phosphatase family protein n=1 Tax=Phaeobacter sp. J2-8 TaxID=2931394 RepID=UPI001FCFAF86|nr:endonuclease/exonuclease/phosphatase family protein [Phaeobacter sp. J2-8]MCJ7871111.1 endonuclease/exonuclease/phosphatase family protein [Phaeobacter sp. J2-8]
MRIATWHVELSRDGPGLLYRDILKGQDPQIAAVVAILADMQPDILFLSDIDHDVTLAALTALRDRVSDAGLLYPYLYAPVQNSGRASGVDLDGDGRLGTAEDALGFGFFTGFGGIALLSRYPIDVAGAQDFSKLLWRDLPGNLIAGAEVPKDAQAVLPLSSTAHWVVPVDTPQARLHVMAFSATPPVFDGPEDRNGRRNHDEVMFWRHYLDGAFGPPPGGAFVLMGNANLDPADGEGRHEAIRRLLDDPRLQDTLPMDAAATAEANPEQRGNPALDTANWGDPTPGNLRVDYVLPAAGLAVLDSGTIWPAPGSLAAEASRHALVWVDLDWPPGP